MMDVDLEVSLLARAVATGLMIYQVVTVSDHIEIVKLL